MLHLAVLTSVNILPYARHKYWGLQTYQILSKPFTYLHWTIFSSIRSFICNKLITPITIFFIVWSQFLLSPRPLSPSKRSLASLRRVRFTLSYIYSLYVAFPSSFSQVTCFDSILITRYPDTIMPISFSCTTLITSDISKTPRWKLVFPVRHYTILFFTFISIHSQIPLPTSLSVNHVYIFK